MTGRTTAEIVADLRRFAWDFEDPQYVTTREAADRLAELDDLLNRLSQWDQMVMGQGDEPYWLREIARVRGLTP